MTRIQIININADDEERIVQAAALLVEEFREHWPKAWPTLESALDEARGFFTTDRIIRAAVDEDGEVLGWVGGISQYDGNVWELHPLVVGSKSRGLGVGRRLVLDLEEQAAARGGLTLWLGTDDEDNMTSLAGADLYPRVWEHVEKIRNLRGHPYEFYQKVGFVIVGVMPDANGRGKPDIYMAKRIGER